MLCSQTKQKLHSRQATRVDAFMKTPFVCKYQQGVYPGDISIIRTLEKYPRTKDSTNICSKSQQPCISRVSFQGTPRPGETVRSFVLLGESAETTPRTRAKVIDWSPSVGLRESAKYLCATETAAAGNTNIFSYS